MNLSRIIKPGGLLVFDMNGEVAFDQKRIASERRFCFSNGEVIWKNFIKNKTWKVIMEIRIKDGNKKEVIKKEAR